MGCPLPRPGSSVSRLGHWGHALMPRLSCTRRESLLAAELAVRGGLPRHLEPVWAACPSASLGSPPRGAGAGELLLLLWPEAFVSLITQTQLQAGWLCSRVTAGARAGGVQPRVAWCSSADGRAVSSRRLGGGLGFGLWRWHNSPGTAFCPLSLVAAPSTVHDSSQRVS